MLHELWSLAALPCVSLLRAVPVVAAVVNTQHGVHAVPG